MHLFDIDWLGNLGIKNGTWEKKKKEPFTPTRVLGCYLTMPFPFVLGKCT